MTRINLGRVVLGGLLAGLLVNVGEFLLHEMVVKDQEVAAMTALGKGGATGALWVWIVWGFVYGVALVWLYAAIRPRFGAGAKTAACAGITAWFFNCLLSGVGMINTGLFPTSLMMTTIGWDLVLSIVAAMAGAWLYKEA